MLAALCVAGAASGAEWRLTRSPNFAVYTQSSDARALEILNWFEQLRAFFEQQGGVSLDAAQQSGPPVRVIVFASEQEYAPYRLHASADAYYAGSGNQNYIVMRAGGANAFGMAAHEYAHLMLRAAKLPLPPWLAEGLADFFSTLRLTEHGVELGGALPGRVEILRTRPWIPLGDLLAITKQEHDRQQRSTATLFYAESWALTEMLMLSPKYASGFSSIVASPHLDTATATRDLREWIARRELPVIRLPEIAAPAVRVEVTDVSPPAWRLLLAHLLLAAGEYDRAEMAFQALPGSAETSAALGVIALHRGDAAGARRAWKRAIEQGIGDARLCYQYAILADQANLPAAEIRTALERAVALQPDFDDARYQLALLEKNSGRYEAALGEFRAMRDVPEPRAFAYWLALADTLNELDRREEAQSAAQNAASHAASAADRARAAEQIYMAKTDLAVQFERDASGRLQLVTTRMPHQQPDWNPFVEPSDDMHRVEGNLREIQCGSAVTIQVQAPGKLLTLAIPDLKQVQMRHAPVDFVCGAQPDKTPVVVDYARTASGATEGIVRGMDFR